jgi:hypothetical protein
MARRSILQCKMKLDKLKGPTRVILERSPERVFPDIVPPDIRHADRCFGVRGYTAPWPRSLGLLILGIEYNHPDLATLF